MSRFVSDKTIKVELNGGEWVEMRKEIPFDELQPILLSIDQEKEINNVKMCVPLLTAAISGWNFKDDDGTDVPFAKDKIKNLNTKTILELTPKAMELYLGTQDDQKKNQAN